MRFVKKILWGTKFKKEIMLRVIPKAEKANTISRSLYTQMVRSERQVMATSMTHYQGGHTVEEEL